MRTIQDESYVQGQPCISSINTAGTVDKSQPFHTNRCETYDGDSRSEAKTQQAEASCLVWKQLLLFKSVHSDREIGKGRHIKTVHTVLIERKNNKG